ncbi:MAG: hypothetical protein WDW36_004739 [Sanguina aurantia]
MASCSRHIDGQTSPCTLRFTNLSPHSISVLWVSFQGEELPYTSTLRSQGSVVQATYDTHTWRLRGGGDGRLLTEYSGPSCMLEVQADGSVTTQPLPAPPPPKTEWGAYRARAVVLGMQIKSYECVDLRAVSIAAHIISCMLQNSPPGLVRRLSARGAEVAIIGRDQVTSDIPAHAPLKDSSGDRDIDGSTRGLGGTMQCPTTSCGEENLLMEGDRSYSCENILVHEFGHTVMNLGLTAEQREAVVLLYRCAVRERLYDVGVYMMSNEDEYFAEATQAWFHATVREDVTDGVNTRGKLKARDPALAAALAAAYGDGPWRYTDDCPGTFKGVAAQPSAAPDDAQSQNARHGAPG